MALTMRCPQSLLAGTQQHLACHMHHAHPRAPPCRRCPSAARRRAHVSHQEARPGRQRRRFAAKTHPRTCRTSAVAGNTVRCCDGTTDRGKDSPLDGHRSSTLRRRASWSCQSSFMTGGARLLLAESDGTAAGMLAGNVPKDDMGASSSLQSSRLGLRR